MTGAATGRAGTSREEAWQNMPAKKIQYENELVAHLEAGRTPQWCSAWYLRDKHLRISANAISVYKHRHGVGTTHRPQYAGLLPWVLLSGHRYRYPAKMLRALGRRRSGAELSDRVSAQLDAWLAERRATDTVVYYDPDTAQGFWHVYRRPDVDVDLIRVPDPAALRQMNWENDQRKHR